MRTIFILILSTLLAFTAQAQLKIEKSGNKYYLGVPETLLSKDILFGSRIVDISAPKGKVYGAGQVRTEPCVIQFRREGELLLLEKIENFYTTPYRDNISYALDKNFIRTTDLFFDIEREDKGVCYVDVTELFTKQTPLVWPLPANEKIGKLESKLSKVLFVKEYDDHINVRGHYEFSGGKSPFAITVQYFMMPLNSGYKERINDNRAGFNTIKREIYQSGKKIDSEELITRWNLDNNRKIIFYIDPAFPSDWIEYIKAGVEDWNIAFEEIGLGRVIEAKEYPDDHNFDPYDVKINTVRYFPVKEANAAGFTQVNPRTGEILFADICWWNDVVELMSGWRFVQTAVADPRARDVEYGGEYLGEMIRYAMAHEMGHVLGLKHNLGASSAYPSDSLNSPLFTQKYGTTPSIMDYARFNHLATASGFEKGVSLLPPRVGVFDIKAIEYGYRLVSSKDELVEIFSESNGEIAYKFAPFRSVPISPDPSNQMESLGDDVLASSMAGVRNCATILENLHSWTYDYGGDYDDFNNRYALLERYYFKYLNLALSNVGGRVEKYSDFSKDDVRYVPVDANIQYESLRFIIRSLALSGDYFLAPELVNHIDYSTDYFFKAQTDLINQIFKIVPPRLIHNEVVTSGETYLLSKFLSDFDSLIWKNVSADNLSGRNIIMSYVAALNALAESGVSGSSQSISIVLAAQKQLEKVEKYISKRKDI